MKINLDTPTDDAQIQIIPLIDVVFCILTFFILAALQMTRQQGMNVDLPKASTGQVQSRSTLIVSIDSAGQTFIEKAPVDRINLYERIKAYHDQQPDGLLVLNASQNAFYNDVIQVLDILRQVGGDRVALATLPATGQPGQQPGQPGVAPNPTLPGGFNPGSPVPFDPTNPAGNLPGSPGPIGIPGQSNPALTPGGLGQPNLQPGQPNNLQPGQPGGSQPGPAPSGSGQPIAPGSGSSGQPSAPGTTPPLDGTQPPAQ
jgi:biopolymer transport protein ExbD